MPDPRRFTGYRLSEALAVGRRTVTLVCAHCDVRRSWPMAELIDRLGDEILPTALNRLTPRCARRAEHGSCGAVYAEPFSREEEARIRDMRLSGLKLGV